MTNAHKRSALLAAALVLIGGAAQAANVTIVNGNNPGEGFNDPTPVAPVTGNPGTTLGQQRLNVFQAAADAWGDIVDSSITIPVAAAFIPLDCDPFGGVLGSAGPRSFIGSTGMEFPLSRTWYPFALANALTDMDLSEAIGLPAGEPNITAAFNSDVDDDPNCLTGVTWYYGIGVSAPPGTIDLYSTVFHEIAHGLGFTTIVDRATGAKFNGWDDTFMLNLEDHSTGELWPGMTNGERVTSAVDTGDLHWVGPSAVAQSGALAAGTHPSGHIRMYAPDPLEPGSSVAHWDTALFPHEIMEPFAVAGAQDLVTTYLMEDIGWNLLAGPMGCTPGATTLCLPDNDRFQVTLDWSTSQGGGQSGTGNAISLDPLGITKGGIFAFTDLQNPEMLVKVLDGCPINNRFWVFFAATTNVGFTLTVTDTVANQTQTYTNPDVNPANAVTDTQAFATCP